MLHFLAHILGLDSQDTGFYMFWSGIGSQASVIVGFVALRWEIRAIRDEERWRESDNHCQCGLRNKRD